MSVLQTLQEKLDNFKQFVKDNCAKDKKDCTEQYDNMQVYQLLIFAQYVLVPAESDLTELLDTICERTGIKDREKLKRYLQCFIDLVKQLS